METPLVLLLYLQNSEGLIEPNNFKTFEKDFTLKWIDVLLWKMSGC